MGSLRFFHLGAIKAAFNTPIFFETGAGKGHGIDYARSFNFTNIYSVEIIKSQSDYLASVFQPDPRVLLICDTSHNALKEWLPRLKTNTLFYLDAHFPGADLGLRGFAEEQNEDLRLPLFSELELIRDIRIPLGFKDVVLIDDIMIFDEDNHYPSDSNKLKMDIKPRKLINGYKQILAVLERSHDVKVIPEDSGFAIITPKDGPNFIA